jgi:hypothetical protein
MMDAFPGAEIVEIRQLAAPVVEAAPEDAVEEE